MTKDCNVKCFSLIICSHNGENCLSRCLQSINYQNLTEKINLEILLVDSCSNDSTLKIMKEWNCLVANACVETKIITSNYPGQSRALNVGLRNIHGELAMLTDDDCTIHPNWISSYINAYNYYPTASYFFGKIIPKSRINFPYWWNLAPRSMSGRNQGENYLLFKTYTKDAYPIGCNMALKTNFINKNGLIFDENLGPSPLNSKWLGAEIKLGSQIINNGGIGCYVPNAVIFHHIKSHRVKWEYLMKHFFVSGRCSVYYKNESKNGIKIFFDVIITLGVVLKNLLLHNSFETRRHLLTISKKIGILYELFLKALNPNERFKIDS